MRKNFGIKTWLLPMPVLIVAAYDENNNANAMNAAWGGIYSDNMVGICLDNSHKTTQNILSTKAFTVSVATCSQVVACDYVGIESGNKVPDKLTKAGFHTIKSEFINAPIIKELPMTLECELVSYDEETCFMVGNIINISADESVINENGQIDITKVQPIVYNTISKEYHAIGNVVAKAFSIGKQLK